MAVEEEPAANVGTRGNGKATEHHEEGPIIRGIRATANKDPGEYRGKARICGHDSCGAKSAWLEERANHNGSLRRFSMPGVQKFL